MAHFRCIHWVFVVSLLPVVSAGCDKKDKAAASVSPPANSAKEVAPQPPLLTDADVASAVMAELRRDPGVDAGELHAHASDGVVELTGRAHDILTRKRAVRVAEAVKGVRAVSDRIELALPTRADGDIARDVRDALLTDSTTDSYAVSSKVDGGKVTLTGSVASYQEQQMAERVVEGVRGVRSVQNDITVKLGVERADAAVAADVRSCLRWDALVNDGLIGVEVHDGRVALTGQVASATEKRRAALDSWVLGVKEVDPAGLKVTWYAQDRELMKNKLLGKADSDIAAAVRAAAAYDPRVSAADLHADVSAGVVTLSGSVGTLSGKLAAEDIARHTVGVTSVKNALAVKPVKPVSDATIQKSVEAALFWNPYTSPYAIHVKAHDGQVTLTGSTETPYERAQATNVAANIHGVKDINNDIAVTRGELTYVYSPYLFPYAPYWPSWAYIPSVSTESDPEIAREIHEELLWSPFVDADQVKVSVEHGKATLTGQVDSVGERMAATDNAFEGGATVVENDLTVKGG